MACRCTYSRSCAGAHRAADEGVAQPVFILHQFHAAYVLLLNGVFAALSWKRVLCRRHHESAGMFLRVYIDDLNLLYCLQAA